MKKIIIACLLSGLSWVSFADVDCDGKVGDVKSSMLSVVDFRNVNGACWSLLDGGDITGTELASMLPHLNNKAPNAHGMFLRAVDGTGEFDTKDRLTGSFQADGTRTHLHSTPGPLSDGSGMHPWGNPKDAKDGYTAGNWKRQYWRSYRDHRFETGTSKLNETGGNDTRPLNIAVYMYVHLGEN